jgi:sugar lactone lactonase YvrE
MQMEFELVAEGEWLEGIAVDGDTVWYSDVFGRGIRRCPPGAPGEVWRGDERWISAIQVNADGKVLSNGATGIVWFDPKGDASGELIKEVEGQPLGGVNEMVADASGVLYFGSVDSAAFERGEPPGPSALYRLGLDGRATQLTGELKFSNGLGLSPDGRRLYHCETFAGVFAYDVLEDGRLGEPQLLIEKADCDGLKIDVEGRIWVAGFKSPELLILRPDGGVDGRFAVPGPAATNHHFGGRDGRDIYITVVLPVPVDDPSEVVVPAEMKSGLWRGRAPVAGLPLHRPKFKLG